MKARKIIFGAMICAAFAISFADAGDTQKSVDAAITGPPTIYNVSDLVAEVPDQTPADETRGDQARNEPPIIDQIAKLIRSTIAPDAWGKTADMQVSGSDKIVVKCGSSPELLREIDGLLEQLRQTRQLYVEVHYRLVDSQMQDIADHGGIVTGLALDRLDHAEEIVSDSQIIVFNGQEKSLWDRALAGLPAVYVQATVSADRTYATVSVYQSSKPGQSAKPLTCTIPAGANAAFRINDPRSHQWLVLSTKLLELRAIDVHPAPEVHGER